MSKKNAKIAPLPMERTSRGFAYGSFVDKYGQECSLQKSSRMADGPGDECIWLGVNNNRGEFKVLGHSDAARARNGGWGWQDKCLAEMFPDSDVCVPDRMHLTQEMVKMLLPALQHFAKTGELPEPENETR